MPIPATIPATKNVTRSVVRRCCGDWGSLASSLGCSGFRSIPERFTGSLIVGGIGSDSSSSSVAVSCIVSKFAPISVVLEGRALSCRARGDVPKRCERLATGLRRESQLRYWGEVRRIRFDMRFPSRVSTQQWLHCVLHIRCHGPQAKQLRLLSRKSLESTMWGVVRQRAPLQTRDSSCCLQSAMRPQTAHDDATGASCELRLCVTRLRA